MLSVPLSLLLFSWLGFPVDLTLLDKNTPKQNLTLSSKCEPDPEELHTFFGVVFQKLVECNHVIRDSQIISTQNPTGEVGEIFAQVFYSNVGIGKEKINYAVFMPQSGWFCLFRQNEGIPVFIAQNISGEQWISMLTRAFTQNPGRLGEPCF